MASSRSAAKTGDAGFCAFVSRTDLSYSELMNGDLADRADGTNQPPSLEKPYSTRGNTARLHMTYIV